MVDPGLGGPEGRAHARGIVGALTIAETVAVGAATLLPLAACQRKTTLFTSSDSATVTSPDSARAWRDRAQQLWDDPDQRDDAADLTARVLRDEFKRLEPGAWQDRARFVLDSLGIGSEFALAPCAMVVNLFVRSQPDAGSWPYVFWCSHDTAAVQALEGKDLRLQGATTLGLLPARPDSARVLAVLFQRRARSGPEPLAMLWTLRRRDARWTVVQSMGPDSLGGNGGGEFTSTSDTSSQLVARTYRTPAGFQECATCPHSFALHRFDVSPQGFAGTGVDSVASPYSTFVAFVQAMAAGRRDDAQHYLSDPSLLSEIERMGWQAGLGPWRTAPGTDETPFRLVFYRGQRDAYAVRFVQRGRQWLIAGIEPANRNVE